MIKRNSNWVVFFILCLYVPSILYSVPTYLAVYPRTFLSKMFFYYPPHETLDRVVRQVLKRQSGAYISFSEKDVTNPYAMRSTFGLNGNGILKALPLQCKDITKPIHDRVACINDSEACYQKMVEPVRKFWGAGVGHLYAPNVFLASFHQDSNRAARFIRLLKNAGPCVIVSQSAKAQTFFGAECTTVDPSSYTHKQIIERCFAENEKEYRVIFFACGSTGRSLIPDLLARNCFIFDCGDFFELIDDASFESLEKQVNQNIHVIYTAAILENRKVERQAEYEKSLNILNSFWYEPYIVEACVAAPTFLNDTAHHVCYTQSNLAVRNKGVNEIRSIRKGLEQFQFHDDDMIVKLTGRYFFKDDYFLRMIENNPDVDGFISIDTMTHFSFTGCFALRYKYFKEIINSVSLRQMEQYWIDFERVIVDYVRSLDESKKAQIKYVDELHVQALVDNRLLSHW